MRIIAGRLKGRIINTIQKGTYRPTTGHVKEAIFNMICNGVFGNIIEGATTIDLYGGTGALSFEAISRGAAHAVVIEKDLGNYDLLKKNIECLDINDEVTLIRGDATNLPKAKICCDIAFIDPPFNKRLVDPTLESLIKNKWLADGAYIIIETHKDDPYQITNPCRLILEREYGHSILRILQYGLQDENT